MSLKKEFENKKEYILKSAQNIFGLFGLKKTTIDDISKNARIGKGTLYNYFKNKEGLFFAVVEREKNELKEHIKIELDKNKDKTAKKKFEIYIKTKIRYLISLKNYYNIKADRLDKNYPEIKIIFDSFSEFEKKTFLNIFKDGIDKKEIKINNLNVFVDVIILTSNALEFYLLTKEKYESTKKIFDEIDTIIGIFYSNIKK
jgi:AcrR family transcriptional regulator